MSGAEITLDILFGVAAFLRADNHDSMALQHGKSPHHSAVLGKKAIAVKFAKIRKRVLQIIERKRSPRMTGHLDPLPGGEIGKYLLAGLGDLLLDARDFLFQIDSHGVRFRVFAQFIQLALQFGDWFFEVKLMLHAIEWNVGSTRSPGNGKEGQG